MFTDTIIVSLPQNHKEQKPKTEKISPCRNGRIIAPHDCIHLIHEELNRHSKKLPIKKEPFLAPDCLMGINVKIHRLDQSILLP